MVKEIELTEEEEKSTHYCKDFCPIYHAVTDYNRSLNNKHRIECPVDMCTTVVNAFVLNKRENNN